MTSPVQRVTLQNVEGVRVTGSVGFGFRENDFWRYCSTVCFAGALDKTKGHTLAVIDRTQQEEGATHVQETLKHRAGGKGGGGLGEPYTRAEYTDKANSWAFSDGEKSSHLRSTSSMDYSQAYTRKRHTRLNNIIKGVAAGAGRFSC